MQRGKWRREKAGVIISILNESERPASFRVARVEPSHVFGLLIHTKNCLRCGSNGQMARSGFVHFVTGRRKRIRSGINLIRALTLAQHPASPLNMRSISKWNWNESPAFDPIILRSSRVILLNFRQMIWSQND